MNESVATLDYDKIVEILRPWHGQLWSEGIVRGVVIATNKLKPYRFPADSWVFNRELIDTLVNLEIITFWNFHNDEKVFIVTAK